jgi:hypothetical protein
VNLRVLMAIVGVARSALKLIAIVIRQHQARLVGT